MRGPHGKGYAEMAVARVPGMGFETPLVDDDRQRFDEFSVRFLRGTNYVDSFALLQSALGGMGNRRSSDTYLNRHLPHGYRHMYTARNAASTSAFGREDQL